MKRDDQLSRTEDNTLAAWVSSSERYATSIRIDESGDFEYFCTCPYSWGPCKHTVAVILAAAEQVKRKESIPLLDENDDLYEAFYGDPEENDEWLDDDWDDDDSIHPPPQHTKTQAKIEKILGDKSRDELLASGQVDKFVRTLKTEIRDLTDEPA